MDLEGMNLKHKAKVLRHKASKSLMDTDMWLLFAFGGAATQIFNLGGIAVETNLDEIETEKTREIVAEYDASLNMLSADYKKATNDEAKQLTLDAVSANINSILMNEDISETNVDSLFDMIKEDIVPISEVFPHEIGNIGDLRECRASFGDNASSENVSACTVEEAKDENMLTYLFVLSYLSIAGFSAVGAVTKRVARPKLEEWAVKKPKIIKW